MPLFRPIVVILLNVVLALPLLAQNKEVAPLFSAPEALPVQLDVSLKEIKKSNNDTVYFATTLRYQVNGSWDSVHAEIRARGNFRRKHCLFPPLRVRIRKKDAKGTLFAGARHLKLVVPCQVAKNYGALIAKELLVYKLYETVTPYAFRTRLLTISLTDRDKEKVYSLTGFFIEDDDDLADRLDVTVFEQERILPTSLEDTASLRLDLFQYMIGNTDFSTSFLHNAKLVRTSTGSIIPVAYDFDMAGLVNAPYATYDESLGIRSVTERAYKGYCRNEAVAQFVRRQFIDAESAVTGIVEGNAALFEEKDLAGIRKYLGAFFEIIRNDEYYKRNITEKCRTQ